MVVETNSCYDFEPNIIPQERFHPIMIAYMIMFFAVTVFFLYLDYRQLLQYKKTEIDPKLTDLIQQVEFDKSQKYRHAVNQFSMIKNWFWLVIDMANMYFMVYAWIWHQTDLLQWKLGMCVPEYPLLAEIIHGCLFLIIMLQTQKTISQPFYLYYYFVLERSFGRNRMTCSLYVQDFIKQMFVMIGYVICLTAAITSVVYFSGDYFTILSLVAVVVIVLILDFIIPEIVQPLYNTFEPMAEGDLKDQVDKQIVITKVKIGAVVVLKTKRTAHSNAYVEGFYPYRKMVIYDTLIEKLAIPKVVAIVTHELGHIYYGHLWVNLVKTIAEYFLQIYIFTLCYGNEEILRSHEILRPSIFMYGFLFNQMWSACVVLIVRLFDKTVSRQMEYQADDFAVEQGQGPVMKDALIDLFKQNRQALNSDWLFSMFKNTHPTLIERLANIDNQIKNIKQTELRKLTELNQTAKNDGIPSKHGQSALISNKNQTSYAKQVDEEQQ